MSSRFYEVSRGPVVKRETLKLVRLVSVSGLGPCDHPLRFERELLTVRETETSLRMVSRNHAANVESLLKEGVRYNDYYGLFTSARETIAEARKVAEAAALGIGSPVRVECVTTVRDQVFLPSDRSEKRLGGTEYLRPPHDWLIDDDAIPRLIEDRRLNRLDFDVPVRKPKGDDPLEFVVWRSDVTEEDNAARLEEVRVAVFDGVEEPPP